MATLKSKFNEFNNTKLLMPVLSESGTSHVYAVKLPDGELYPMCAEWNEQDVVKSEAYHEKRWKIDGSVVKLHSIVPEGDFEVIGQCTLEIRNFHSPDAESFRINQGLDLARELDDPKFKAACNLTSNERTIIKCASCVTGMNNIISEDEDGNECMMEYSEENVINLLTDLPYLLDQIDWFGGSLKKFEGSR